MVDMPPLSPQQYDALSAFLTRVPVGPAEQVAMRSLQEWMGTALARWQQEQQAQAQAQQAQQQAQEGA